MGYLLQSVSVLFVGLDYCSFPTLGKDPLERWLDRFELYSRDLLKLLIRRGVPRNEGFAPSSIFSTEGAKEITMKKKVAAFVLVTDAIFQ